MSACLGRKESSTRAYAVQSTPPQMELSALRRGTGSAPLDSKAATFPTELTPLSVRLASMRPISSGEDPVTLCTEDSRAPSTVGRPGWIWDPLNPSPR